MGRKIAVCHYLPILAPSFNDLSMKKTQILTVLVLSATLLAACTGKTTDPTSGVDSTATDASLVTEQDTMTYGTSYEFGMSTFTLVTDAGDTLYLTRDAADGSMAQIYGDIDEGQRYAITTRDGGDALGTAINLTQLDKFVKGYKLLNGRIILATDSTADTLKFVQMDNEGVTFARENGETFRMTQTDEPGKD